MAPPQLALLLLCLEQLELRGAPSCPAQAYLDGLPHPLLRQQPSKPPTEAALCCTGDVMLSCQSCTFGFTRHPGRNGLMQYLTCAAISGNPVLGHVKAALPTPVLLRPTFLSPSLSLSLSHSLPPSFPPSLFAMHGSRQKQSNPKSSSTAGTSSATAAMCSGFASAESTGSSTISANSCLAASSCNNKRAHTHTHKQRVSYQTLRPTISTTAHPAHPTQRHCKHGATNLNSLNKQARMYTHTHWASARLNQSCMAPPQLALLLLCLEQLELRGAPSCPAQAYLDGLPHPLLRQQPSLPPIEASSDLHRRFHAILPVRLYAGPGQNEGLMQ